MTPMAAKMFRLGDATTRKLLIGAQFIEASAIVEMAREMGEADVAAGCNLYSEFAHLPSPETVIEFMSDGHRLCFLCTEEDDGISWGLFVLGADGEPTFRCSSGFVLNTEENLDTQWQPFPSDPAYPDPDQNGWMGPDDPRVVAARGFNILLEKMLCILNQPGLVQYLPHRTDKRILRQVARDRSGDVLAQWHECRVRPGNHNGPHAAERSEPARALHYVRKHFKPSVQKWVEGYWRGDIALGLHRKIYTPEQPKESTI